MIFYRIINKRTRNTLEFNKIFYSELEAYKFAEKLNEQLGRKGCYVLDPFIYIMSPEEKEMYSKVIDKRRVKNIFRHEKPQFN